MSLVSPGDAAVMLIRNTALYTLYTQPSSLIKLYPVHAPHCCGSLGWETLNRQMQHVIMCYLLSGFLIFVVLSVLSEKTSVPVSGRRDPLNAWRSQYHVWREREGRQCEEPKYVEKYTVSHEYQLLFTGCLYQNM